MVSTSCLGVLQEEQISPPVGPVEVGSADVQLRRLGNLVRRVQHLESLQRSAVRGQVEARKAREEQEASGEWEGGDGFAVAQGAQAWPHVQGELARAAPEPEAICSAFGLLDLSERRLAAASSSAGASAVSVAQVAVSMLLVWY